MRIKLKPNVRSFLEKGRDHTLLINIGFKLRALFSTKQIKVTETVTILTLIGNSVEKCC